MEDESLSSVDQFLRDNGFSISDTALELASLSDDELLDDELLLSDAEEHHTPTRRSHSSTSEPPRFVLLDDESLLMDERDEEKRSSGDRTSERLEDQVEGASSRQDQYQPEQEQDSLDRSMLFGGSDLSLSSATSRVEEKEQDVLSSRRSSISSSSTSSSPLPLLHQSNTEQESTPLSPRYQTTPPQEDTKHDMDMVSAASSAASSLPSLSSSLHPEVSVLERDDDELNDALGVHRSSNGAERLCLYSSKESTNQVSGKTALRSSQQSHSSQRSEPPRMLFTDDGIGVNHSYNDDMIHNETSVRLAPSSGVAESKWSQPQSEENNVSMCDVREEKKDENDDTSLQSVFSANSRHKSNKFHDSNGSDEGAWKGLNDLLRRNGLPSVRFRYFQSQQLLPDRDSLFTVIHDFAMQLERKNEIIQDLVLASQRHSRVQSRREEESKTVEQQKDEVQKKLEKARAEIQRLKILEEKQRKSTELLTKNLKNSCLRLQQQVKVSEHRVKAKEMLVEKLQTKLQQQVDKETANKTRVRHVFRNLQDRDPQRANPRDLQALETLSVYEAQREQMQEEMEHLKSEMAALNSELRDKENLIARQTQESLKKQPHLWEQGSDASSTDCKHPNYRYGSSSLGSDNVLVEQLEAARREQEVAAATLRHREAKMMKKVARIEQELLNARETICELKEENANLALEAESRPSIREYRLCQRRIQQLERQVAEHKLALEEASDLYELRKYMGTKELVERDRLNHRLHLNRLNTLPRETTLEVVKQVCRILHLTDITLIAPSLMKLCSVVAAVPRMEQFIRDVCGFVFLSSKENISTTNVSGASFALEQVLPTLQAWMMERKQLYALKDFQTSIVSELSKRDVESAGRPSHGDSSRDEPGAMPPSRAVEIVRELVQLEKSVVQHREMYTNATAEVERHPQLLINQIVQHFQHVFQVKRIEGVFPKINELYLQINEIQNFLHALGDIRHLKKESSLGSCLNAIKEQLVENAARVKRNEESFEDSNKDGSDLKAKNQNFVVEKRESPSNGWEENEKKTELVGVRQVRQMSLLIRELKRELGAATMDEILPRTKRLMELLSLSIPDAD